MKLKIIFLLVILMISLVGAEESGGTLVGKQNDCIQLVQSCADCTYVKITSIQFPNMTMTAYNTNMEQTGTIFNLTFCSTASLGNYVYCTLGDVGGTATPVCKDFYVTPSGKLATTGTGIFYVALLGLLIVFLIMSIYTFMNTETLLTKVGMFGLSYVLLIAVTFIGWTMAGDFLYSTFIIKMLRILFIALIVGAFPLFIGSFAYYFIMVTKIKEIKRLMRKGLSEDEAYRRSR